MQWSFDVQRALPAKLFLTVGYVGSQTSHLDNTIPQLQFANTIAEHGYQRPPAFPGLYQPGRGQHAAPARHHSLPGQLRQRQLQRAPGAGGETLQRRADHGLGIHVRQSPGEGYGRNDPTGDVQSDLSGSARTGGQTAGRYGFDITHNAVINYVYDLPMFRNRKGLVHRALLGGWQTSGMITLQRGTRSP